MATRVRVTRTKYGAKLSFARLAYRPLTLGGIRELTALLAQGATLRSAACALALGESRVLGWMERGAKVAVVVAETCDYADDHKPEDKMCFRLYIEVEKAKAVRINSVLRHLESGMMFDWRAAAWWLERQSPDFKPQGKAAGVGGTEAAPAAVEPQVFFYIPENGRAKV